jgi:hypothetical protein
MRTGTLVLFLIALLAGSALPALVAEDFAPGLRGPILGYVLDAQAQAIRPVNGIPGSSSLGRPLALPFPVAAAALSPRGDFALTVSASDDHTAYLLRNLGGAPNVNYIGIEGAISGADRIFLNADASAAAMLVSDTRQLQVLRGLPDAPRAGPALDLSSIPGTIAALAIASAGSNVLIAASAGHGALYLASAGEQIRPRLIGSFGSPSALTLLNNDQDVIVADVAVNELTLLRNFAGVPESFRLAGVRDGISGPAGLGISADGTRLYIANGGSRTLDIWSFALQAIEASFPLDARPTQLVPFQGSSTFVLNNAGEHPLLLLDTAADPAVYFVPAVGDR